MTHLEIVNRVLRRLREDQVGTIAENEYAQLIGTFVADAYEILQEDWEWEGLKHRIIVDLVPGQIQYRLSDTTAGAGDARPSARNVQTDSVPLFIEEEPEVWLYRDDNADRPESCMKFLAPEVFRRVRGMDRDDTQDYPYYYTLNTSIDAGEREVNMTVFPEPVLPAVMEHMFYTPDLVLEVDGSTDSNQILIPYQPVFRLALMTALNERGEEIGEPGNIAEQNFLQALGMAKEREVNVYERPDRYDWRRD